MKLIGSLLIILASVVSSFFYEKNLKENLKNTVEICELIKYIKSKIEYFSTSINEILQSYETDNCHIKEYVLKKDKFNCSYLDKSVVNQVNDFFDKLGKGYKKEQITLCDYTISLLESSVTNLKENYPKKAKLFRSLSLFFAIGCVIILI